MSNSKCDSTLSKKFWKIVENSARVEYDGFLKYCLDQLEMSNGASWKGMLVVVETEEFLRIEIEGAVNCMDDGILGTFNVKKPWKLSTGMKLQIKSLINEIPKIDFLSTKEVKKRNSNETAQDVVDLCVETGEPNNTQQLNTNEPSTSKAVQQRGGNPEVEIVSADEELIAPSANDRAAITDADFMEIWLARLETIKAKKEFANLKWNENYKFGKIRRADININVRVLCPIQGCMKFMECSARELATLKVCPTSMFTHFEYSHLSATQKLMLGKEGKLLAPRASNTPRGKKRKAETELRNDKEEQGKSDKENEEVDD